MDPPDLLERTAANNARAYKTTTPIFGEGEKKPKVGERRTTPG